MRKNKKINNALLPLLYQYLYVYFTPMQICHRLAQVYYVLISDWSSRSWRKKERDKCTSVHVMTLIILFIIRKLLVDLYLMGILTLQSH